MGLDVRFGVFMVIDVIIVVVTGKLFMSFSIFWSMLVSSVCLVSFGVSQNHLDLLYFRCFSSNWRRRLLILDLGDLFLLDILQVYSYLHVNFISPVPWLYLYAVNI